MTGTSNCFNINLRNEAIMLSFARPDNYRD
jgi:hypothetical protein